LNKRFIHGVPTRSDMQMLFMEDAIYKLSDKGRATIITNGSPLFNGGAKDETKEIGNESSIRK
jgi:type I restriction enzyme M protein